MSESVSEAPATAVAATGLPAGPGTAGTPRGPGSRRIGMTRNALPEGCPGIVVTVPATSSGIDAASPTTSNKKSPCAAAAMAITLSTLMMMSCT